MPSRSATSPPLKKLPLASTQIVGAAGYRRDCASRFHSLPIFTGHFFHFIAWHPHATLATNWRCNWFCRRMPSTEGGSVAKASVNKVVFHSTNATVCHRQAEAGGHQDHFAGIGDRNKASSNSDQFSSLSRKRAIFTAGTRWRYCAGHPVPAALFLRFNRKIQFTQRSCRKVRLKIHSPLIPTTHIFFAGNGQTGTSANLAR